MGLFQANQVNMKSSVFPVLILILATASCNQANSTTLPTPIADRLAPIPANATKVTPANDFWPPIAVDGWSQPEPMAGPVNTAGAEDSPFIMQDGNDFYFFFTPDVSIAAEKQLLDGVTGIWVIHRNENGWSQPVRVRLENPGDLALDGCEFVSGNVMYFCTTRAGYTGIQWFRANLMDGRWQDWQYAGDELKQNKYQMGELHISTDGQELYFHSARPGGFGGLDVWVSLITPTGWGEPVNLGPTINTSADEGWPDLSADGQELWFNGQSIQGSPGPAIFRSLRQPDGSWGVSKEIVSSFAGEPSISGDGKTLYFVHHFYSKDMSKMLEADIYISKRLEP
jgi:hypothetical protein